MKSIALRRALKEDTESFMKLVNREYLKQYGSERYTDDADVLFKIENEITTVATFEDKIVGCITGTKEHETKRWIAGPLAIDTTLQKNGIAELLIKETESLIPQGTSIIVETRGNVGNIMEKL